jgi:hypothetical protein
MRITRAIAKTVFLAAMVVAGSGGLFWYYTQFGPLHQIAQLEAEKHQLVEIVDRLKAERRIAKLVVLDQKTDTSGAIVKTTCMFAEYARDGKTTLVPRVFNIDGKELHVDSKRITFDHGFVEEADPLRGQSIVLFVRAYGNKQAPADGTPLETAGEVPEFYRGSDPQISKFEQELWQNFWRLFADPDYAKSKGVRVANGEGKWMDVALDTVYLFSVQADGGMNVTAEPVDPVVREWIRHVRGL